MEKKKKTLDLSTGYVLPTAARTGGSIFLAGGLIGLATGNMAGISFLLLGWWLYFFGGGTEINVENKAYRRFTGLLGLKFGNWMSLEEYPFVVIIQGADTQSTFSRGQSQLITRDEYFDITLLNQNHSKKLAIKRLDNLEDAKTDLAILADMLQVTPTRYNPPISAKTQARKRARR